MVRVVGIDPGTSGFDFCGLDGGELFLERSLPTRDVNRNPEKILGILASASPLDLVFGPSGYGLPLKDARKLSLRDEFLMHLGRSSDKGLHAPIRLKKLLGLLVRSNLPVVFGPSVKHLMSVPTYRKLNKIDMGTADKVCVVALAIVDQARHLQLAYDKTSFILVEVGFGFNAVIGVENGSVIDGIGGTTGSMGFLSPGSIDAEVAYLRSPITKSQIFTGGAAYVASLREPSVPRFLSLVPRKKSVRIAWECWMEGLAKDVASMMVSVPEAREILLSGTVTKFAKVRRELTRRLGRLGKVRSIKGISEKVKGAAQGAALIADGLAGGSYAPLVDVLGLKRSGGTVLDNLYVGGALQKKQRQF